MLERLSVEVGPSLLALALCASLVWIFRSSLRLPLPPGPPGRFVTGNVHQWPKHSPWYTFAEWAKTYGPVFRLRILRTNIIILNSATAVADLLESRAAIYSDRPQAWMYRMLIDRQWALFQISSAHPRHKTYRKLFASALGPAALHNYVELQRKQTGVLLNALKTDPEKFVSHIRRNAGAVILSVAYGRDVTSNDDEFIQAIEESFALHGEIMRPGRWMVDTFPILRFVPKWFPGAGFKHKAEEYKVTFQRLDRVPHDWAMDKIKSGNYTESFTSRYMLPADGPAPAPGSDEEDIIKWCSAALYVGGADTTVSALTSFVLLMTLNPEAQKRAQDEIDELTGRDRLPTLQDKSDLPYVQALIKEVLRWEPVAPLGLPHSTLEDDVYQGYRIPKGTTVLANIWALMHDSATYPDPFAFNPDRFLGPDPQQDPGRYVWGFGRRVCAGMHFAEQSLFLNITSMLATYSILKPLDENGKEFEPSKEYVHNAATQHPKPFSCRFVLREHAQDFLEG